MLSGILKDLLGSLSKKTLCAASGSSGIGQWTADELQVISHCELATQAAWNAMMTWEETGLTPETIKEVRIVYVPKDNEQSTCEPKKMRPISVFSFLVEEMACNMAKS